MVIKDDLDVNTPGVVVPTRPSTILSGEEDGMVKYSYKPKTATPKIELLVNSGV
jgi:hypothetical protein